jgi:hypothetical protein
MYQRIKSVNPGNIIFDVYGVVTRNRHRLVFSEDGLTITIKSDTSFGWEEVKIKVGKEKSEALLKKLLAK